MKTKQIALFCCVLIACGGAFKSLLNGFNAMYAAAYADSQFAGIREDFSLVEGRLTYDSASDPKVRPVRIESDGLLLAVDIAGVDWRASRSSNGIEVVALGWVEKSASSNSGYDYLLKRSPAFPEGVFVIAQTGRAQLVSALYIEGFIWAAVCAISAVAGFFLFRYAVKQKGG